MLILGINDGGNSFSEVLKKYFNFGLQDQCFYLNY